MKINAFRFAKICFALFVIAAPAGQFAFADDVQEKYVALPLVNGVENNQRIVNRYGVPFIEGTLPIQEKGKARLDLGGNQVERIFLLGMTYAKPNPWSHPRDFSMKFFVGDELGRIRLDYADGSTQVFPLLLGEGVWWGRAFYDYPEPFPTDARLREAFATSMRLYPPAPVMDGNYLAVIHPRLIPIRSIMVRNIPLRRNAGGCRESRPCRPKHKIAGATILHRAFSPEFDKFEERNPCARWGRTEKAAQSQLEALRLALYSSDENFTGHVAQTLPPAYSGPTALFKGNLQAEVLANAFHYNVQDIRDKVGEDGMYHTSTKAPCHGEAIKVLEPSVKISGAIMTLPSRATWVAASRNWPCLVTPMTPSGAPIIHCAWPAFMQQTPLSSSTARFFRRTGDSSSTSRDGHLLRMTATALQQCLFISFGSGCQAVKSGCVPIGRRSRLQAIGFCGSSTILTFPAPPTACFILPANPPTAADVQFIPIAFAWTRCRRWHKWPVPLAKTNPPNNGGSAQTTCGQPLPANTSLIIQNMAVSGHLTMPAGRTKARCWAVDFSCRLSRLCAGR